eukprot:NODE_341_length_10628_cov_0.466996.p2 type:complete len:445 gc:universal NODE_341_length_10628_cov_0.466996:7018-5684(-)
MDRAPKRQRLTSYPINYRKDTRNKASAKNKNISSTVETARYSPISDFNFNHGYHNLFRSQPNTLDLKSSSISSNSSDSNSFIEVAKDDLNFIDSLIDNRVTISLIYNDDEIVSPALLDSAYNGYRPDCSSSHSLPQLDTVEVNSCVSFTARKNTKPGAFDNFEATESSKITVSASTNVLTSMHGNSINNVLIKDTRKCKGNGSSRNLVENDLPLNTLRILSESCKILTPCESSRIRNIQQKTLNSDLNDQSSRLLLVKDEVDYCRIDCEIMETTGGLPTLPLKLNQLQVNKCLRLFGYKKWNDVVSLTSKFDLLNFIISNKKLDTRCITAALNGFNVVQHIIEHELTEELDIIYKCKCEGRQVPKWLKSNSGHLDLLEKETEYKTTYGNVLSEELNKRLNKTSSRYHSTCNNVKYYLLLFKFNNLYKPYIRTEEWMRLRGLSLE